MIESVHDGDRIIFAHSNEAMRVERLLKERSKDVECITKQPSNFHPNEIGTSQGRTVFDHSWVEEFYLLSIDRAMSDIDYFQKNLSGFGEPHYKTQRMVREAAKWQL